VIGRERCRLTHKSLLSVIPIMKFVACFVAFAAVVAIAAADTGCILTPPLRDCAWNVELKSDTERIKYYVNGRFLAKESYDNNGKMTEHTTFRPDINYTSFKFTGGKCTTFSTEWDEKAAITALSSPTGFISCDDNAQYDGKKCKKFDNTVLGAGYIVYATMDEEPIAITISIPLVGSKTYDVDFGSSAGMSKFAFDEKDEAGCDIKDVYKKGDDDFVFCAASTVNAVFAVVLAALALALF